MAYDNIVKALGPGNGLTPQQQAENYDLFGKMMKEGISLKETLAKIDSLESEIKDLKKPKESPMDAQLFSVMEQAVREVPAVMEAKRRLQDEKTRIISELCMADEAYRKCFDQYRTAVNAAYVDSKERPSQ